MPNRTVRIKDDVVYREIDGDIVALSINRGEYIGLDAIGSFIWKLIEQSGDPAAIRAGVLAEFDVNEAACDAEIEAFLAMLNERGLIAVGAGA